MNDRIKELAKRAGAHIDIRNLMSNPPQRIETVELWDDRIEKFTSLIINECIRLSKETCIELETDESIQTPGFKTNMNLYHTEFLNNLERHFGDII